MTSDSLTPLDVSLRKLRRRVVLSVVDSLGFEATAGVNDLIDEGRALDTIVDYELSHGVRKRQERRVRRSKATGDAPEKSNGRVGRRKKPTRTKSASPTTQRRDHSVSEDIRSSGDRFEGRRRGNSRWRLVLLFSLLVMLAGTLYLAREDISPFFQRVSGIDLRPD
jgi:hypothetical protein